MIITKQKDLDAFCKKLSKCEYITVDTEFLREKTYYPKLCLIQVSTPDKDARAIDPLSDGIDLKPLMDLFGNKKILKVFHAGRQDLEIFFNIDGKVPSPVFDTQIAAMVLGYGDSVGYESLVKNICNESLDKSSQFTNWSIRPLSDKQLHYAIGDVTHLCDIYEHLKKHLEDKGRLKWVQQEEEILSNPETYENHPEDMWQKVKIRNPKPKALAVLRELAAWREREAQKRNQPRSWVMRDDTLADMAYQAPQNINALKKIRNIPKDADKSKLGQTLLKLIEKALKTPKDEWPVHKKKKPLSPAASSTVDILRLLLKIKAAEHGVATKLIACATDLEALAMEDRPDIMAMKGWRFDIFGKDALAIKNGDIAIGLQGSKIIQYDISDTQKKNSE